MRKIWDKIVAFILGIPEDKRLHFCGGMIVAAFFALALGMNTPGSVCFIPALFVGFFKEFFDLWTGGKFDWWDLLATTLGGVILYGFVLLHAWWF